MAHSCVTMLMTLPLQCQLCQDLLPSVKSIKKKMAGLSSPMVLAFVGSLLGLGETFIFLFILWSYLLVKLTNSTIVISCMGSLGFLVGNNFDCGCYLYPHPSRAVFLDVGVVFVSLLDLTRRTAQYIPSQLVLSGLHLALRQNGI